MTDVTGIEKTLDTALSEAQAALPAIQTLLTVASVIFPQAKIASTILSAIVTAAPDLVALAKKLEADLAPVMAALAATPAA